MLSLLEATRWFVLTTAELVALFLALSILIGLLQAWIPEEKVRLVFEKRGPVGAYAGGAVLGAITPFCSYVGDHFEAYSTGTSYTDTVHPCAVEAMEEVGVDISDPYPKS